MSIHKNRRFLSYVRCGSCLRATVAPDPAAVTKSDLIPDFKYTGLFSAPPPPGLLVRTQQQTVNKGDSFLLDPRVRKIRMGLSWETGSDVDSSAVLCREDHSVMEIIGFLKLSSSNGAVTHRLVTIQHCFSRFRVVSCICRRFLNGITACLLLLW